MPSVIRSRKPASARRRCVPWLAIGACPPGTSPPSPCLSSRLAPGVEVTRERTGRVEAAESYLRELGYRECRVRLHEGELARIEVPAGELARLADPEVRAELVRRL